jgi:hypothetical protein
MLWLVRGRRQITAVPYARLLVKAAYAFDRFLSITLE